MFGKKEKKEELRICNECKEVLNENEVNLHYQKTGHMSYNVFSFSEAFTLKKILELETRIEQLEEFVKMIRIQAVKQKQEQQ